jgi:hypothetical protein
MGGFAVVSQGFVRGFARRTEFALFALSPHNGDAAAARGAGLWVAREFTGRKTGSGAENRARSRRLTLGRLEPGGLVKKVENRQTKARRWQGV